MFFALLKDRTLSSLSSSFQKCWKTKLVNAWEAPWDPYMISGKQAVWFKLSATLFWKLDCTQCCLFPRVVLCLCQLTSSKIVFFAPPHPVELTQFQARKLLITVHLLNLQTELFTEFQWITPIQHHFKWQVSHWGHHLLILATVVGVTSYAHNSPYLLSSKTW